MAGTQAARLKRCFSPTASPPRVPPADVRVAVTRHVTVVSRQPMSLPLRAKPALAIGAPIYASVRRSPDHRIGQGEPAPARQATAGLPRATKDNRPPAFCQAGRTAACTDRLIRRPRHRTFGARCSPSAPRPRMPVSRHPQPRAYYLLFSTTVPGIVMVARQAPPLLQEPQEPMRKRKTIASLYISPSFGWSFLPH
ncbi:AaceriAGL309Wp [[Ashbya] aceris (nom. inval.)]|nr:AaceriAGL309Wp [[Ashbya] aceris (nom. inval.)]